MHAALANWVPATRSWNWACVISTSFTVISTLEKFVPAGYCTVRLFVPKLNTLGRGGLNGGVIDCEVGGTPAIAIPCGPEPTGIVPVILLLAVLITDTLLVPWFVTYAEVPSADIATPNGTSKPATVAT